MFVTESKSPQAQEAAFYTKQWLFTLFSLVNDVFGW